jgi:glycosyltransferase involved in cell wall biosynthesis
MLSIIICTYNREKYIYNCLKSVAENDFSFENYEIVLINNNSTDNTEYECKRFKNDLPQVNFRYFVEKNQGLSFARNRGITEAKGDILAYVDDDATINNIYLKTIADFFANNKNAFAAGGAILPVYETQEPKWFSHHTKILITTYKNEGKKIIEFKKGKFPGGGNSAYRKDVFEKIGLYNTDLGRKGASLIGAEEKDIFDKMRKKNMKFYYLPDMILYHIIPPEKLTQKYFDKLTFSIGQSEKVRTLNISKSKYFKRMIVEAIKWMATVLLFFRYLITFQMEKGAKLLLFRWNVTKGLFNSKS